MNKRAILFCPYFGGLPNNIDLWIFSASYNNGYDFLLITDDSVDYTLPSNIKLVQMSFGLFKDIIQSKFDFEIQLNEAYKICDFRPAFAYCLSDLVDISGYQFWGYCDLDVVFGDLDRCMPPNIETYAKISYAGHFSLLRNERTINEAFLRKNAAVNYVNIFTSSTHFAFDEIGEYGINSILKNMGEKIFAYDQFVAHVSPLHTNLAIGIKYDYIKNKSTKYDFNRRIFSFENGHVYAYTCNKDSVVKKEWAYIHLQKRKMEVKILADEKKYLICSHCYDHYLPPSPELIYSKLEYELYQHYIKVKLNAGCRKIRRIFSIVMVQFIRAFKMHHGY